MHILNTLNSEEVDCKSIEEFVDKVFGGPPPTPNQYQLSVDGATTQHDIFRTLGQLLTYGLVYLYGAGVDVRTLSDSQIQKVQEYLQGFGYKVLINPQNPADHPQALPWLLKLPAPQGQTQNYVNIAFEHFY